MNNNGFVPVKDRKCLSLSPTNEAVKVQLEEKLKIPEQIEELKSKAKQRWAQIPWEETCDQITIRTYDYGQFCVGIMFTVSAQGDDLDGYAAYLLPTKEDMLIFNEDFNKIVEEGGFKKKSGRIE